MSALYYLYKTHDTTLARPERPGRPDQMRFAASAPEIIRGAGLTFGFDCRARDCIQFRLQFGRSL